MMRKKKIDLVMSPQGKSLVDSSTSGNRKRGRLLQRKLLKILTNPWKRCKLSNMCMMRRLKDWQTGIYTYGRWWVIGKVWGGEAREVKVRNASENLTGRCSCTVICWGFFWSDIKKLLNYSRMQSCFYMRTTSATRKWGKIFKVC